MNASFEASTPIVFEPESEAEMRRTSLAIVHHGVKARERLSRDAESIQDLCPGIAVLVASKRRPDWVVEDIELQSSLALWAGLPAAVC
jgi:hypothetical protein